jgi:hypothetical protein
MAFANEIISQAERRLNELLPGAPVRWSRSELVVFLNDGIYELNLIAADWQKTVPIPIDNTNDIWPLPAGTVAPLSAYIGSTYLLRESVENLDKEMKWEYPTTVRLHPTTWSPIGLYMIVVAPKPVDPTTVNVEVLEQPTLMTDATVVLPVRPEYERPLEDYIISRAMFKEGGAEFSQYLMFYNRFLDSVQQLSGRNIIRSYPAWHVQPETKISDVTLREESDPQTGSTA